jgi:tetratricopeptide (TPR) repeat protein
MRALPARLVNSLCFLLALSAFAQPLLAAEANPRLVAHVQGVSGAAAERRTLRIDSLDIKVRVHGTIAETVLTAKFANPGSENLEGDFTLAMPTGSVVTGYALDIGGAMIDGVLVDQRQARLAYEARLRVRVDPGLAEVGRDNLFRTRIFPIPPGGARTIRLSFASPFDPQRGYVLPLSDAGAIGAFSLDIYATGMAGTPRIGLPDGSVGEWESASGNRHLVYRASGAKLDGSLAIDPSAPAAPLLVSRHPGQGLFFQIVDSGPAGAPRDRGSRRVVLLWDRSLSRADDLLSKEIELVRAYLERVRPETIELLLFDSGGVERVSVADADAAAARLRAIRYSGGTSLAVLAGQGLAGADACLLCTDGLVTLDRRDGFRADCPLFVLSSAPDADRAWLGSLARKTGGEAIDLGSRTVDEAMTRLTRRVPRVVDVRTAAGAPIDHALLDGGELGWRIVGPMPETGDILVRLAGLGSGIAERLYSPSSQAPAEMAGAGALWAADRVGVRAGGDDLDRAQLVAFARNYSVASPEISFVVLETAADYARAGIEPPAGFAKDQRSVYDEMRQNIDRQSREAKDERLSLILRQWDEQQAWWRRRFDPYAKPPRERANAGSREGVPAPMTAPPPPSPPPPSPPPPPEPSVQPSTGQDAAQGDVTVTGSRTRQPVTTSPTPVTVVGQEEIQVGQGTVRTADAINSLPQAFAGNSPPQALPAEPPSAVIALAPWAPDRPYLAALDAARPADLERVFAEQQAKHGALPAFWLDVAEYYYRKGRRAEALSSLLSALELPTRNSQTLSIVADRLVRYGALDRAIFLLERLAAAEADRPQPKRTLALALAKRAESGPPEQRRADLARAISLLAEVVMTPWSSDYDGIEMISLMEANRLIALYRALGGEQVRLDRRLVALLDVDLRIVIEWNSEATDLDLWVDEPNGERAIYNNPRTVIGGRLSNDMTSGFGPEEYLLRRAPNGTFTVRANVFAADRLNPNGASSVTARLIRDFGRPTQREEVVDIELLPDARSRERLIGKIDFRR